MKTYTKKKLDNNGSKWAKFPNLSRVCTQSRLDSLSLTCAVPTAYIYN